MTEKTRLQLLAWAREYHCAAFIQGDPVQFPHRYMQKQDIEVSGLLTAIMSFGNRRQILKKADGLHGLMGASPYRYVLSCRWKEDFLPTDRSSFYRMLSHADFYTYFARLHAAYTRFDSLEDAWWRILLFNLRMVRFRIWRTRSRLSPISSAISLEKGKLVKDLHTFGLRHHSKLLVIFIVMPCHASPIVTGLPFT